MSTLRALARSVLNGPVGASARSVLNGSVGTVTRGVHERQLAVRKIIGDDGAPKGAPLVHVRCGDCGTRVATVEDHGGAVMTLWRFPVRPRRFPGVPSLECACGPLTLDAARLKTAAARARHTGAPVTVRTAPRAQRC